MRGRKKGLTLDRAVTLVGRSFLSVLCSVLLLALALYAAMLVLTRGPSQEARRLFVLSASETSALKFLPSLCLPQDEVDLILTGAAQPDAGREQPDDYPELPFEERPAEAQDAAEEAPAQPPAQQPELEVVDISGATFKGKLLIVKDPARVVVGTLDAYGGGAGLYLSEFLVKYDAVAGTNAGGFEDINGNGNGGTPDGMVIRDGALAWGNEGKVYSNVIGFDAEHRLHVGNLTVREALDLQLVSAVSFTPGPVLIRDGELLTGLGGGMNPRTCIGQREDGSILLAVIEGRHPNSLGATYDDLAELMNEYGAVNAANLDGGSSSAMYYEGEQITKGSNLIGSRRMATAILVLRQEGAQ